MKRGANFADMMRELGLEKPAPGGAQPLPRAPDDQIDLSVQGGKFLGPRKCIAQPRAAHGKSSRRDGQGNSAIISVEAQILAGEGAENVAWETRLRIGGKSVGPHA